MRRFLIIPLLLTFYSCGSTVQNEAKFKPIPVLQSPVEKSISGGESQELPISSPVNPERLDLCTRHLLFVDQYITASDYDEAEDELKEAAKYCSANDPRFLYMEALLNDIWEKRKKAYELYYRAAKGYIKRGNLDAAFKCYSGMLSINPNGKEVKELSKFFEDQDY